LVDHANVTKSSTLAYIVRVRPTITYLSLVDGGAPRCAIRPRMADAGGGLLEGPDRPSCVARERRNVAPARHRTETHLGCASPATRAGRRIRSSYTGINSSLHVVVCALAARAVARMAERVRQRMECQACRHIQSAADCDSRLLRSVPRRVAQRECHHSVDSGHTARFHRNNPAPPPQGRCAWPHAVRDLKPSSSGCSVAPAAT
jgi:hypothetical protein